MPSARLRQSGGEQALEAFLQRVSGEIPELLRDGRADKIYHTYFEDGSSLVFNAESGSITGTSTGK